VNRVKGLGSALAVVRHAPFLLRYLRATHQDLLDPIIGDPLLKAVLAAQGGDYGLPPSRASAFVGLGVLDHYLGGAYFPIGGSRALRDGLVRSIEARGGETRRNTPVERILLQGGSAAGVRCKSGEEILADRVISNVDATVTYRDLVGTPHLSWRLRRKTRGVRHSLGSVCLFLGLDVDVASYGMTDANVWTYPHVDFDACYAPMERGHLPAHDFFFLSSPSLKDPDSPDKAPAGHSTLELVTLVPFEPFAKWEGMKSMKRGAEYEALKARLADRYLGCVERYVPDVRQHLRVIEVATPVTNITYAGSPRGAIYGPDHTPDQMGPFRFAQSGGVPGLYLCGASTFGAGIVPSGLSGYVAGKLVAPDARPASHVAPRARRTRSRRADATKAADAIDPAAE
jgi:phytoene dehydrogenase-like protein